MSTQPVLTLRDIVTPFNTVSLNYVQSAAGGNNLPVLQGQNSNPILFRVYNNFALSAGIASAVNVSITTYDGSGSGSHTCALLPVSQSWVRIQEYGYGENSVASPDQFTSYLGSDTAIGGNTPCGTNTYTPEIGSDGSTTQNQIRAFSTGSGTGYIEFSTYAQIPDSSIVQNQLYNFAISVNYEWFA